MEAAATLAGHPQFVAWKDVAGETELRATVRWPGDEERLAEGIGSLPGSLRDALDAMEHSELVKEALGDHVFENFLVNKRREWADYKADVTPFEIARYLGTL